MRIPSGQIWYGAGHCNYFQDDLSQYLLNFKINIVFSLQIKKQIAQDIDLIIFFGK